MASNSTTQHTPETLTAVVSRTNGDYVQEAYTLHGLPQMPATQMGEAIRNHDALTARVAELEAALKEVFIALFDEKSTVSGSAVIRARNIIRAVLKVSA